jgi:hypothetical protein
MGQCIRFYRLNKDILGLDEDLKIIDINTSNVYTGIISSSDYCIGTDKQFKKFDKITYFCAEKTTY